MGKQHFDLLSPPLSRRVKLRGGAMPGEVSDDLVFLSAECAYISIWTAFGFGRAVHAVSFQSPVFACFQFLCRTTGVRVSPSVVAQLFALRADVAVVVLVPGEVGARPGAILTFRLVEDGNEGKDFPPERKPDEIIRGAVGRICSDPIRLQTKAFPGAVDHLAHCPNFGRLVRATGIHVDDDIRRQCCRVTQAAAKRQRCANPLASATSATVFSQIQSAFRLIEMMQSACWG